MGAVADRGQEIDMAVIMTENDRNMPTGTETTTTTVMTATRGEEIGEIDLIWVKEAATMTENQEMVTKMEIAHIGKMINIMKMTGK